MAIATFLYLCLSISVAVTGSWLLDFRYSKTYHLLHPLYYVVFDPFKMGVHLYK